MADKRIYQLDDATTLTGKYIPMDKDGNTEAERLPIETLLSYRCDSVVVTSGSDVVTFNTAFADGSVYKLPVLFLVNSDGDKAGGTATDLTDEGFTYTSEGGTLTYVAMIKR